MLNILVLSQRTFRSNSCAWIFLTSSVVNLISIICGLTTRIISGWILEPDASLDWFCKARAFVVFSTRTIAPWLIALATYDRWLLSNSDARWRHRSTLKNAQIGAIIITIFSILLYIQIIFCYKANLIDTPLKCYGKTVACRYVTDFSFSLITIICPLVVMVLFGLLTIKNVRQSQNRVNAGPVQNGNPIVNRSSASVGQTTEKRQKKKNDQSLLKMLFVQVLLLIIFTLPLAVDKLYTSLIGEQHNEEENAINSFVYDLAILSYFISNGLPFYVYTLAGGVTFRKALYNFILKIKEKLIHR